MNKEWSELNKEMQLHINRKNTFDNGKAMLLNLRRLLYVNVLELLENDRNDLNAMPYINNQGFESKNVLYSIYHIFRIEDIVTNVLIRGNKQDIFLKNNYKKKLNSPIITTGNELEGEQIANFTKEINVIGLLKYIETVYDSTNELIINLTHNDLKRKVTEEAREVLLSLNVVNLDKAEFLVDYWCHKDIYGLIKMPLSRHWIMHIEAANRIINKVTGQRKLIKNIKALEEKGLEEKAEKKKTTK